MRLGRKNEMVEGRQRATALVVDADPPLANGPQWLSAGRGTVTILVDDAADGPTYVAGNLRLTEDRWLVRGMEIPVSIDPEKPERFEVDWDAIPSIEERVAANDPTLADPSATQRKVAAALDSAGVAGPAPGVPRRGMTGGGAAGAEASSGSTPNRLEEAIERAAQQPAPPGKQRAVVMVATITSSGDTSMSASDFQSGDPNV